MTRGIGLATEPHHDRNPTGSDLAQELRQIGWARLAPIGAPRGALTAGSAQLTEPGVMRLVRCGAASRADQASFREGRGSLSSSSDDLWNRLHAFANDKQLIVCRRPVRGYVSCPNEEGLLTGGRKWLISMGPYSRMAGQSSKGGRSAPPSNSPDCRGVRMEPCEASRPHSPDRSDVLLCFSPARSAVAESAV